MYKNVDFKSYPYLEKSSLKLVEKLLKQKNLSNFVGSKVEKNITSLLRKKSIGLEKYKAKCVVNGILLVCNDITKLTNSKKEIGKETYEEYLDILSKRDPEKDKWIYNIIDGISEQESILYNDDKCIVIPSYIWDSKNIKNLHILCIPKDKSGKSIAALSISRGERSLKLALVIGLPLWN